MNPLNPNFISPPGSPLPELDLDDNSENIPPTVEQPTGDSASPEQFNAFPSIEQLNPRTVEGTALQTLLTGMARFGMLFPAQELQAVATAEHGAQQPEDASIASFELAFLSAMAASRSRGFDEVLVEEDVLVEEEVLVEIEHQIELVELAEDEIQAIFRPAVEINYPVPSTRSFELLHDSMHNSILSRITETFNRESNNYSAAAGIAFRDLSRSVSSIAESCVEAAESFLIQTYENISIRTYPSSPFTTVKNTLGITCFRSAPLDLTEPLLEMMSTQIVDSDGVLNRTTVKFDGELGLDHGALSRQFWTTFFQAFKKGKLFSLKALEMPSGSCFPYIDSSLEKNGPQQARSLGHIIGFLLGSEERYPVGEIFDPIFFQELAKLNPKDFKIKDSKYPYLENLKNLDLVGFLANYQYLVAEEDQERFNDVKTIVEATALTDLDPGKISYYNDCLDWDLNEENFEDKKKEIFNDFKRPYVGILFAIFHIAVGLKATLKVIKPVQESTGLFEEPIPITSWQSFKEISPERIQFKLQGKLTPESFYNSVQIHPYKGSPTMRERIVAQLATRWFREWVAEANISQMRNFLQEVTGSPALIGITQLIVSRAVKNTYKINSCYRTVDLPVKIEKAGFRAIMAEVSSGMKTGEFTAV